MANLATLECAVMPDEVYSGRYIQFCTKICSIWHSNASLTTLATVAHRATLFSMFYWIDLTYLMLLRIKVSM